MSDNNKYNLTMLLPKTDFGMRGKLPTEEVKMMEFWNNIELWKKLREQSKDKKKFILHDGPPYANGPIHIGTAANKILKDIINRTMQFEGYNSLYVPGWDCHGLPIEWQIEKQYRKKGKKKEDIDIKDFRNECREFAQKWIEEQKKSFIRLFVLADWNKPYTTMAYESEAIILKEFSKFFLNGSLYQGSKPVMWSPIEKTALAEAEIEYHDIDSTSIYVAFKVKNSPNKLLENTSVIIWTTTPWTIPGNRAIAFGDSIDYCIFKVQESKNNLIKDNKYLVAKSLLEEVCERCSIKRFELVKEIKGDELNNTICLSIIFSLLSLYILYDLPHMLNNTHRNKNLTLYMVYGETITQLTSFCLFLESSNVILNSKINKINIINILKNNKLKISDNIQIIDNLNNNNLNNKLLIEEVKNDFKKKLKLILTNNLLIIFKNLSIENIDLKNIIEIIISQFLLIKNKNKNYNIIITQNKLKIKNILSKYKNNYDYIISILDLFNY